MEGRLERRRWQLSAANSPPKRAYGRVTRIGKSRWRCYDGTEFDAQHLAYRHLHQLEQQELLQQQVLLQLQQSQQSLLGARGAVAGPTAASDSDPPSPYALRPPPEEEARGGGLRHARMRDN